MTVAFFYDITAEPYDDDDDHRVFRAFIIFTHAWPGGHLEIRESLFAILTPLGGFSANRHVYEAIPVAT